MINKYDSIFESNTNKKIVVGDKKPMRNNTIEENTLIDFQTNSILMLNQILAEITNLNKKLNELKESKPTIQEKTVENKRRINLIRDENGKIVSADVIDINLEEKTSENSSPENLIKEEK